MLKFINNKKRLKKEKEEEQRKTMIPQEILEDKNKNFIVSIFVITEQDIISFYGINMINSYERFYERNNHKLNYVEYNKILENRREIENTEIYINGEKIYKFEYRHRFQKAGKNNIIYKFNKPLKTAAFLFYEVDSMISIDLSNFNSRYLNITSSMFQYCYNLENINFTNFNVENLIYTDYMFHNCKSLKLIGLPNLNLSKIQNSYNMFKGCNAKVIKNN